MRLVLDAGNTDTVFGLHDGQQWLHTWRTRSLPGEPSAHYEQKLRLWLLEAGISAHGIGQTVLSSVVPDLTPVLRTMLLTLTGEEPVIVGPAIYPLLPLVVLRPYEIGTDLVANAMAAFTLFKRNCVVVDFGTALSFTTVSASGEILGVAITPGLRTAVRSLFANTAQLPEVPLEMPRSALGKNTTEAIQAGVVLGYEGLVRSLVGRIRAELDGDCFVIGTGGLVSAIPTLHPDFDALRPGLTLDGLLAIGKLAEQKP
ncbi:type III pantothenate kinase [Tellurirhabdus rosea]|uniref:type III pantothenate kinase n=1 Tax=Tellurirhabdus rosea TaxID=2674997 RepID=UPI00224EE02E|nr:type III pantothenate kinase [Tellurirhabdus rosea]